MATPCSYSVTELYLSLGSNLGDRHALLLRAIDLLARRVGRLIRASSFIETEPWGYHSPNRYLNAVVLLHTDLTPHQVLLTTQAIERQLGRTTKTPPPSITPPSITPPSITPSSITPSSSPLPAYSDRPIDIDILLYGDLHLTTPDLTIPHPRMMQRDFVLRPLREIQLALSSLPSSPL